MSKSVIAFHHIGLLTGQPEEAIKRLQALNYLPGEVVFDPLQEVELCMCIGQSGEPSIEIITPTKKNNSLSNLLKRRNDYMYHVCFTTPSFAQGLEALTVLDADRVFEITPPKPAVLFDGAKVAFYSVPGLGLVELLEQV